MEERLQEAPARPWLLGELLTRNGHVTPDDLSRALELQERAGGRIGSLLVRIGAVSEEVLLKALSDQLGFPVLGTEAALPTSAAIEKGLARTSLGLGWLKNNNVLLWDTGEAEGGLGFTANDPLSVDIQDVLGREIAPDQLRPHLCRSQDFQRLLSLLDDLGGGPEAGGDDSRYLKEIAEQAPTIELVNNLLSQAVDMGASDVHLEPGESKFTVRFRVDGVLHTQMVHDIARFDSVASRIKLIAGLDIAERRLPQDGRVSLRLSGTDMDLRVSTIPAASGESIVLRLLAKDRGEITLEALGMQADDHDRMRHWVTQPHGIILVTGPTGSGKSTTLYAGLTSINDGEKKIITVEDPVEYQIEGITQIQAHAEIDYTFPKALRAILRHDPDVIMIGEIRDLETAEIAVQAALTGHLVLSTLHTNDAVSAFTRLTDMGVEPYLVASPIIGVQAQRLVRRLCPDCAEPADPPGEIIQELRRVPGADSQGAPDWRQAMGCPTCRQTGYRGRLGIYEMVPVTDELHEAIIHNQSARELRQIAESQGVRDLRGDGLMKAARGLTSVEEVVRVTADS